jgi:hypothetical protein
VAHTEGSAADGGYLFLAQVEDFSDGEVDVVFVLCTEGGGSAKDDELLFALTCSHLIIVILCLLQMWCRR